MPEFRFKDLVLSRNDGPNDELKVVVSLDLGKGGYIHVVSPKYASQFSSLLSEEEFYIWARGQTTSSGWDGYRPSCITVVANEDNWWINNHGALEYSVQDQEF